MDKPSGALQVEDLKAHFGGKKSLLSRKSSVVHAVDGVSFEVPAGNTLGIVGEYSLAGDAQKVLHSIIGQ